MDELIADLKGQIAVQLKLKNIKREDIGDDQPLFFWSGLTLHALLRVLLGHKLVSSKCSRCEGVVPQPGSDPDDQIGHAVANRARLPVSSLGD